MSITRTLDEVIQRLTGIHPVREKLETVAAEIERHMGLLIEHEKRLTRLETIVDERLPRLPR